MSQETMTWLNTMTLIGFTEKRGNAWHYRATDQGTESNHYTAEIPVEDVKRRLFNFDFVVGDMTGSWMDEDGVGSITSDERITVIRKPGSLGPDDRGDIVGTFKKGFNVHPYNEWLIGNVGAILDDDLRIGSAGLLKGGAVAWVQVEMPETITTPEGVAFRPFLTAATSVDGSLSSTYQTGAQLVVCDNTLAASMTERTDRVKIRHSKYSLGRIDEVRGALGIVYSVADDFAASVKALVEREVTAKQFDAFVDAYLPIADDAPAGTVTRTKRQRDAVRDTYTFDERANLWKGTAFGVVQAVNTYEHHIVTPRGAASKVERNMLRSVEGQWEKRDQAVVKTLNKVLATV